MRPRTKDIDSSVLQKKDLQKIFQAISKKRSSKIFFRRKRSSKNFFRRSSLEETKKRSLQIFRTVSGVFQQNFNCSKIVLSSSRGQGNFRGLEASRPRTSTCVLEDSTSACYVFLFYSFKNTHCLQNLGAYHMHKRVIKKHNKMSQLRPSAI